MALSDGEIIVNNQNTLDKEIELIQACINRMAQNSFMIKGWTISLVAVVLALLPETVDFRFLSAICIISTICFWFLDAFYLKTEKLYRKKYEWVIAKRIETLEFSYDLNPYNSGMWLPEKNGTVKSAPCIVRVMFTKTLTPIYCPLLALSIIYFIFNLWAV